MKKIKVIINFLVASLFLFRLSKVKADICKSLDETSKYSPKIVSTEKDKQSHLKRAESKIITSEIAIAKGTNLYSITRKAINLLGGMKLIVKAGDKVFIKPNYISGGLDGHDPVSAGEISHPEVVASVAEECVKAGAKEVIIGEWCERPIKINFGGERNKEGAQVKNLIEALNKKYGHKIYLVNLMEYTTYFKYVPSQTRLKYLAIPNLVAEADVVISIPSLKTHHYPCPVSLGMKNFMGIMPSVIYGEPRYKLHEAGIHQIIVDINKAIRPALVVVSGGFGMEGRGASLELGGKPVAVNELIGAFLVIAGRDPVATDAIATRIITKNWSPVPENQNLGTPWYVHHIRMANEQGLGTLDTSKILIRGEELDSVEMNWEKSDDGVYPELPEDKNNIEP